MYRPGRVLYQGVGSTTRCTASGRSSASTGQALEYDGEWQEDQRHGVGRCFRSDGTLKYDGEWKNNRRNGVGRCFRSDGTLKYDGEWKEDRTDGWGREYAADGVAVHYEGEFDGGVRCGLCVQAERPGAPVGVYGAAGDFDLAATRARVRELHREAAHRKRPGRRRRLPVRHLLRGGPRGHLRVRGCGHRCVCGACRERVLEGEDLACPLCRVPSRKLLRIF